MHIVNIGIVGAGALGLLLGSRLALADHAPLVFVRPERAGDQHQQTIDFQGLHGRGAEITLLWTSDPARSRDLDVLIVLVPSWATREALLPFADWLQHDTLIVSLQNGLGNDTAILSALPDHDPSRISLGVTGHGAWRPSVHSVVHAGSGETSIGFVEPGNSEQLDSFANLLSTAGIETRVAGLIMPFVWRKLMVSAAINGLTAVTGLPNGAIATDPELAAAAVAVAREVAAVAGTRGIEINDADQHIIAVARSTAANCSSMLSSLEAGRRTEVEAIHGAVVKIARDNGITVPLTAMLAAIIRGRELANAREHASAQAQ